jgi:hypothetical protein
MICPPLNPFQPYLSMQPWATPGGLVRDENQTISESWAVIRVKCMPVLTLWAAVAAER